MKIGTFTFKGITIESEYPISDVPCGTCVDCCSKLTPYLTNEEFISGDYAYTFMKVDGSEEPVITIPKSVDGGCMYLVNNRCSIYSKRPKACRQFDCRYPETSHAKISNKFDDFLNFTLDGKNIVLKLHEENELSKNRLKYGNNLIDEKLLPYINLLKEGDVYVDVGANIGLTSIFAAKIVGKSGKVYAFEPDLKNYNLLLENIKLNNLTNVTAINKAVLDKNEQLTIMNSINDFEKHLVDTKEKVEVSTLHYNGGDVDCITLDSLLQDIGEVDLIKINASGSEVKVLNGGKNFFENKVPKIILNYDPSSLAICGSSFFEVFTFIDKNNYIPFKKINNNFVAIQISNMVNLTEECMLNNKNETLYLRLKSDEDML
jgi:FkbM family methyltransferase